MALVSTYTDGGELPIYTNPQAWRGPEIQNKDFWTHVLTDEQRNELHKQVMLADQSSKDIKELDIADFSLPSMDGLFNKIKNEVLRGSGVFLLRGLPIEEYSVRQSAIAFWAIGKNIGMPVSQNGKGHLLGHVANVGLDFSDPQVRGYQTSARLAYHTDASDVVGLICLRPAKSGGLSSVVSSTTLWNELVQRNPHHARLLMSDFHRTRWGEVDQSEKSYMSNPIFVPCKDRIFATYARSALDKAQKLPEVPRLNSEQIEALDHLDSLAADPTLHLDMNFKTGDIQLLSNHHVFHARTTYEDWPDIERRRHLLRLWLACDDGPEVPEVLLRRYGTTPTGRPNGIVLKDMELITPLTP